MGAGSPNVLCKVVVFLEQNLRAVTASGRGEGLHFHEAELGEGGGRALDWGVDVGLRNSRGSRRFEPPPSFSTSVSLSRCSCGSGLGLQSGSAFSEGREGGKRG